MVDNVLLALRATLNTENIPRRMARVNANRTGTKAGVAGLPRWSIMGREKRMILRRFLWPGLRRAAIISVNIHGDISL